MKKISIHAGQPKMNYNYTTIKDLYAIENRKSERIEADSTLVDIVVRLYKKFTKGKDYKYYCDAAIEKELYTHLLSLSTETLISLYNERVGVNDAEKNGRESFDPLAIALKVTYVKKYIDQPDTNYVPDMFDKSPEILLNKPCYTGMYVCRRENHPRIDIVKLFSIVIYGNDDGNNDESRVDERNERSTQRFWVIVCLCDYSIADFERLIELFDSYDTTVNWKMDEITKKYEKEYVKVEYDPVEHVAADYTIPWSGVFALAIRRRKIDIQQLFDLYRRKTGKEFSLLRLTHELSSPFQVVCDADNIEYLKKLIELSPLDGFVTNGDHRSSIHCIGYRIISSRLNKAYDDCQGDEDYHNEIEKHVDPVKLAEWKAIDDDGNYYKKIKIWDEISKDAISKIPGPHALSQFEYILVSMIRNDSINCFRYICSLNPVFPKDLLHICLTYSAKKIAEEIVNTFPIEYVSHISYDGKNAISYMSGDQYSGRVYTLEGSHYDPFFTTNGVSDVSGESDSPREGSNERLGNGPNELFLLVYRKIKEHSDLFPPNYHLLKDLLDQCMVDDFIYQSGKINEWLAASMVESMSTEPKLVVDESMLLFFEFMCNNSNLVIHSKFDVNHYCMDGLVAKNRNAYNKLFNYIFSFVPGEQHVYFLEKAIKTDHFAAVENLFDKGVVPNFYGEQPVPAQPLLVDICADGSVVPSKDQNEPSETTKCSLIKYSSTGMVELLLQRFPKQFDPKAVQEMIDSLTTLPNDRYEDRYKDKVDKVIELLTQDLVR